MFGHNNFIVPNKHRTLSIFFTSSGRKSNTERTIYVFLSRKIV